MQKVSKGSSTNTCGSASWFRALHSELLGYQSHSLYKYTLQLKSISLLNLKFTLCPDYLIMTDHFHGDGLLEAHTPMKQVARKMGVSPNAMVAASEVPANWWCDRITAADHKTDQQHAKTVPGCHWQARWICVTDTQIKFVVTFDKGSFCLVLVLIQPWIQGNVSF